MKITYTLIPEMIEQDKQMLKFQDQGHSIRASQMFYADVVIWSDRKLEEKLTLGTMAFIDFLEVIGGFIKSSRGQQYAKTRACDENQTYRLKLEKAGNKLTISRSWKEFINCNFPDDAVVNEVAKNFMKDYTRKLPGIVEFRGIVFIKKFFDL
jgi:hypothetical protein